MVSSPPTTMLGRWHSTQRGSRSWGWGSSGSWITGSKTLMIWLSTSTARGTNTGSVWVRMRRSATLVLPVPGGP